jgi:superfamily I DNA/RNA helicase/RecB family exonuclease
MTATPAPYKLVRTAPATRAKLNPDPAQQAVLDHTGGPLLVLAGPGTGKTTTLVEAVARRVEAGLAPDQVLVLTFSRKAATELRERITARLGVPAAQPSAWTFHSFCYALVREHQPADLFAEPLRLLSAPEQDVALRELLRGSDQPWPDELRAALATRGLAEEVRALLSRAREVGLDPPDLRAIAQREDRGDWAALADFFAEYLDVLDAQGVLDYAELVHRAVLLAEQPAVRDELRERYRVVLVDEYQDTDPAQERLLQALAGDGRDLVVVGDPDQAIYAFRGAEVSGLLEFPGRFRTLDGRPAPTLALTTCRRSGKRLLEASRLVAEPIPAPGLPGAAFRRHRALEPGPGMAEGVVEAHTYPSAGAEAEAVAELLRREHLERGTTWSRMAVLVRSGQRSIPLLRRVLSAAGVPLEVAGDELPLAGEPAVAPLLMALRVVADPSSLTAETARRLMLSPLVGADPSQLRRLGRDLRELDRQTQQDGPSSLARPSAELLREAVADPRVLLTLDSAVARPAERLSRLLRTAAEQLDTGGPEAALWALWQGSSWPQRLVAAAQGAGATARAADRDLDAVVALFDYVGQVQSQRPKLFTHNTPRADSRKGVVALLDELEAQHVPGSSLSERGVRREAVRLLTAHRSKGLEWEVVVVTGLQEGVWPDLRRRSTLLESDRLGRDDLRDPADRASLLVDERRLFYVAATRARRRLVVTAVDSPEDEGDRPSRFLGRLGVEVQQHHERVNRPLSLPAMVAALRRLAVDPTHPEPVRRSAAARLARLAHATDRDGRPLAPAADPDRWWGMAEPTDSDLPVVPAEQAIWLSGTSLSGLEQCPLRWFLHHEVHADSPASTAMSFGGVLHALAHEVGTGRTDADLDVLMKRLDKVWGQLAYDAPWQSAQQHDQAKEALRRFLAWHGADRGRTLVATEAEFKVPLQVQGREVVLRGSMDRVETDAEGRVHVVDFKTGKTPVPAKDLEKHPQLGSYQLAVRQGAIGEHEVAGAELVMLRLGDELPKVSPQPTLPEGPSWLTELMDRAVTRIAAEDFSPLPSDACDRCDLRRCCPAQPEGRQVVE